MATCKDCLSHSVCYAVHSAGEIQERTEVCKNFKNKADFVEVVRCEKCRYGDVGTFSITKDRQEEVACYCNLKNRVTDIDSYCPSGKRK